MKKQRRLIKTGMLSLATATIIFSCSKVNVSEPASPDGSGNSSHRYGLVPMTPDQWANVPDYHSSIMNARVGATTEVLPTSCLLLTPAVRDQGQIGSCTGFCGSETNEILKYYKSNNVSPITGLTSSTGASAAASNHFSGTLLSPLFLYYVERCVINKQSITTDAGAAMVNICQSLQGLSKNTTGGTPLTLGSSTFKGQSTEALYAYPNPAAATTTQFKTAPPAGAISNAPTYSIGTQVGLTTSSNTTSNSTTSGYFVLNSTGNTLIADIKDAIYNKKPVMMGFQVYDKTSTYSYFESLNASSYTYNPLTSTGAIVSGLSLLGGHAVPIVGYINDSSKPGGGVFIVQNSWGTNWGYSGYFYMPYSVVTSTKIVPAGNLYVML